MSACRNLTRNSISSIWSPVLNYDSVGKNVMTRALFASVWLMLAGLFLAPVQAAPLQCDAPILQQTEAEKPASEAEEEEDEEPDCD